MTLQWQPLCCLATSRPDAGSFRELQVNRDYTTQQLKACGTAMPSQPGPQPQVVFAARESQHLLHAGRKMQRHGWHQMQPSDAGWQQRVVGWLLGVGVQLQPMQVCGCHCRTRCQLVLAECLSVHCNAHIQPICDTSLEHMHFCCSHVPSTASCCSACNLAAATQARKNLCHWQKAQSDRFQQDWGSGMLTIP